MRASTRAGLIGIPERDGRFTAARYRVQQAARGVKQGINGGRIVKLEISLGGAVVAAYDHGEWTVKPEGENANVAYHVCLENFN